MWLFARADLLIVSMLSKTI